MKMEKNSRISGVADGFPVCEKQRKEVLINGNGSYASMLNNSWGNVFNEINRKGLNTYEVGRISGRMY